MYLYGLILHIYYVLSNNLKITDFILTGNNGEISSSIITHTHIAKGVLGQIFSFFGKNYFQTTDAGSAYVGIFSSWLFGIGALLFVFLMFQAFYYFTILFRKILNNKNKRQKIFLIIGYAVLSFSLIKTTIDGGVLNPSFIIGLIFIALFIIREKGKSISKYYFYLVFLGIILIGISLYLDTTVYYQFSLGISSFSSLLLLYSFILYGTERDIRLQFFIPLIVVFLIAWWGASARDRSFYNYSNIILEKDQQVYYYNDDNYKIETLKIDKVLSIKELSNQLGKNITYTPIAAPFINCIPHSKNLNLSFYLLTPVSITDKIFNMTSYLNLKKENSIFNGKNWITKINIYLDPCTPEILSVINGELIKNNIKNYLIINPILNDSTNF